MNAIEDREQLLHHIRVVQQGGNESYASFKIIWQACLPAVKSTVLKIGLGEGDMEDAVQLTCIALWKKIPTFDIEKSSVTTYAQKIAHNRAIDFIRGNSRRERRDSDYRLENVSLENIDAHTHSKNDTYAQVLKLIETHWKGPTIAIVQGVALGESLSEIASRLGLPVSTVKTKWRRFRLLFIKDYGQLFTT